MQNWSVCTADPGQTRALGQTLGRLCPAGFRIFLSGDLGAGKTCLTQGIGQGMGVPEDEPVTSPSYTLMNHYRGRCDIYHFDLYRLCGPEDLEDLGYDEYAHGDGLTIVEWAERAGSLQAEGLHVRLGRLGEQERVLEFTALGQQAQGVLESLSRECGSVQENP